MINLLPDKQKKEIKEARSNAILARWSIITLVTFGILILVLSVGYLVYIQSQANGI